MKYIAFIIVIGFFFLTGCIKAPDYPIEPEIKFEGLSSHMMKQSEFNIDSTILFISFTDGDGDIGHEDSLNVFLIDKRDNFISNKYRLPFVPVEGSNNGLSGDIQLTVYTTCCTYPNGQPPCTPSEQFPFDTLVYQIYMIDRAGNKSNTVETTPIILNCQ